MSDNLGTFTEEEFVVIQPQQNPPEPPEGGNGKKPPEKPKDPKDPEDSDNKEVPVKTKEEILDKLRKAGIGEKPEDSGDDDDENGEDKPKDEGTEEGGEPKDDGKEDGGEKKDDGEPKDEGTEEGGEPKDDGKEDGGDDKKKKKGKVDKGQLEDIEGEKRREKTRTINAINKKIDDYHEILIKDEIGAFKLPKKAKGTLEKAKKELEELKEKLK